MDTREPSFAAFLRHRYRAHVQGWLLLTLGVATVAYVPTLPNEPLWLAVPVAFLAAVFVVAIGVLAAGLLRFPWWLVAPLTFVSMAIEWGLREVWHRPWCRRPQPWERFLSNPFALWQRRRLRRRRTSQRTGAEVIPLPQARLAAPVPRVASPPARRPAWSAVGLGAYMAEVFVPHWIFWIFSAPVGIMLWLWLVDDQMFIVALILAVLLWFLGSVALLIPIAAALLALASAFFIGAGLTPPQRHVAVQHAIAARAAQAQATAATSMSSAPQPRRGNWVWPLLLGLWIGSAWGGDE